jgi:Sigma-54 interaction domain/FHA domain
MTKNLMASTTTVASPDDGASAGAHAAPTPGLVLAFADGRPRASVFRLNDGALQLGRGELAVSDNADVMLSREHLRFTYDGEHWHVTDLDSRNGTFVGGKRISGQTLVLAGSMVRAGGALLLVASDVVPFEQRGLGVRDGTVGGPALRQALEEIALTQSIGMISSLMIAGESGTGKEIAAKTFHAARGKASAPFAAVNCATIPKDLAERLLFGSRRGAFSGATDAPGHVQAAHGGTLFLDEVAELPLDVQSKLLRMLETREVLRLGATSYEQVDVRVCAATWRNLRHEVSAGRFREDLYFRIGQPEVRLPPLRERREEVPWHIQHVLDELGPERPLSATAAFVEACALRHWPGNVRELRGEVRRAAATMAASGSGVLGIHDLSPTAGEPIHRSEAPQSAQPFPADEIAVALAAANGNVASAARSLGLDRNKVRRWLEAHSLDAASFKAPRRS